MAARDLVLSFANLDKAEAGQLTSDLEDFLRVNFPTTYPELRRNDEHAMDMGTSVALVLGTPAMIALAKGIADWIKRQGDPALVIENGGKKITVKDNLSDEAKRQIILEALQH